VDGITRNVVAPTGVDDCFELFPVDLAYEVLTYGPGNGCTTGLGRMDEDPTGI
jgi:hypothetical protein